MSKFCYCRECERRRTLRGQTATIAVLFGVGTVVVVIAKVLL